MVFCLPATNDFGSTEERRAFYEGHIFHERQMNACPIGCVGCAVSASTTNKGVIRFNDVLDTYKEAASLGAQLKITKVEGYDPVFVRYPDAENTPFAETITSAIDLGHQIITPFCTTGSWSAERTQWQIEEIGKLEAKYRHYTYPSGNSGEAFVLSVPREINPFANNRYDFDEHIVKLVRDIEALTVGGRLEALLYYNSKVKADIDHAHKISETLKQQLSGRALENTDLLVTDFNEDTTPESCYRYENSILMSDRGFDPIDTVVMDWNFTEEPALAA